ncbi:MAG: hypothetical protein ACOC6S_03430 [Chloroflexota bacterium]
MVQSPFMKRDLETGDVIPYLGGNLKAAKEDNEKVADSTRAPGQQSDTGADPPFRAHLQPGTIRGQKAREVVAPGEQHVLIESS